MTNVNILLQMLWDFHYRSKNCRHYNLFFHLVIRCERFYMSVNIHVYYYIKHLFLPFSLLSQKFFSLGLTQQDARSWPRLRPGQSESSVPLLQWFIQGWARDPSHSNETLSQDLCRNCGEREVLSLRGLLGHRNISMALLCSCQEHKNEDAPSLDTAVLTPATLNSSVTGAESSPFLHTQSEISICYLQTKEA